MERKSVLILIGALLLAGATAATAYSRFISPQQVSQGTYPEIGTGYLGRNGMMGGGMMGQDMMGWGYGGQQTSTAGYESTNATTGWNWQEMWSWCRNMMSGFGSPFAESANSSVEG
jgi:hypothetical protein